MYLYYIWMACVQSFFSHKNYFTEQIPIVNKQLRMNTVCDNFRLFISFNLTFKR